MTSDGCVHHWIIEPAEGPTSTGICAKCKASKNFINSSYTAPWTEGFHDPSGAANRRKLIRRKGPASLDEIE